jgi:electron transfer flavoprotein beta subunit
VSDLKIDPRKRVAIGRREIGGGYEIIQVPLPAVISVKTASNEPRFMNYEIKEQAMKEAHVTTWLAEDLDIEVDLIGEPGSPTIVTGLGEAESRERKQEFIDGNLEQMVDRLTELLVNLH